MKWTKPRGPVKREKTKQEETREFTGRLSSPRSCIGVTPRPGTGLSGRGRTLPLPYEWEYGIVSASFSLLPDHETSSPMIDEARREYLGVA